MEQGEEKQELLNYYRWERRTTPFFSWMRTKRMHGCTAGAVSENNKMERRPFLSFVLILPQDVQDHHVYDMTDMI